jgi:hypothetical protein
MKNILFFLSLIFLVSCAKPGGGGGGGGGTPTAPTGSANLVYSEEGFHFGLIPLNTLKEKTITITNTGTKKSGRISLSSVSGSFSLSNNTCQNVELEINSSCSFKVSVNLSSYTSPSTNLTISQIGASNKSLSFAAKGANFVDTLDQNLVISILANQNNDGSFNDTIGFDMGTTLYALKSISESKAKANYPQNIWSGTVGLDLVLDYLQKVDDDGNGPNSIRNIDFSSDKELVISQWTRPNPVGGMKLKELLPTVPLLLENATQIKNSSNSVAFNSIDDFLDSRRMSTSSSSMMAQYAYIMDYDRWVSFYPNGYLDSNENEVVELQLKDLYITLDSLISSGKNTQAQELSKAILLNFLNTSDEIFDDTGIRLRYSSSEFNHTSFKNANISEPLFTRINTCRMSAYVLLLVSLSLDHADFNDLNVLFDNTNLKKDLENTLGQFFWPTLKETYIDDPLSDNRHNCIPIAALAALKAPRSAVPASVVNTLYNEVFTEADAFQYEPNEQGSKTALIEAIEAIQKAINN